MSKSWASHPVPGDIMENKETFLRFFSVTSIIAILIALIPGLLVFLLFAAFGGSMMKVIGIVLWLLIEGFAYFVTMQKRDITAHRYDGGGRYIYQVWIEKYKLKRRGSLYIKGYDTISKGDQRK